MDIKIIFAVLATVISVTAFVPYIRDIFQHKTTPHAYTWFIWVIVQAIAVAGILYGNGKWGALELGIATLLVAFICILSFKYGTKNITLSDTVSLVVAIAAGVLWWLFKNAQLAVLIITVIDLVGYIPTVRKAYQEPWSETLGTWTAFTIGNLFSIAALKEFNFLTLVFIVSTTVGNGLIALFIMHRRSAVLKPVVH